MKKVLLITIIIISIFTLSGCKQKENEYKLIELQSSELLNHIINNEHTNLIIALYYDNRDNSKEFIESLNKVANNMNENIYYLDMNHWDVDSLTNLYEYIYYSANKNGYYVFQDGEVTIENTYSDYVTLLKELKGIKIKQDIVEKIPSETKLEAITKAKEKYNEGNISDAMEFLNQAWDLQEAKEEFNNNELYNLIGFWEGYYVTDNNSDNINYIALIIFPGVQEFYEYETNGIITEIQKPNYIDYDMEYYKVENNIIYLKKDDKSKKYEEKYRIIYVNEEEMQLVNIKENQKINLIRRLS